MQSHLSLEEGSRGRFDTEEEGKVTTEARHCAAGFGDGGKRHEPRK